MEKYKYRLQEDWNFSNRVHEAASSIAYKKDSIISKATFQEDSENGIDYWAKTPNGKNLSIQERFRTLNRFTINSQEFTIRYTRPNSTSENQKKSEFFKIKADLLLYGITNNENKNTENPVEFRRFVVVNLHELFRAINNNDITIDENLDNKKNKPYLSSLGIVTAISKDNVEDSKGNSKLLIFNVSHILKLKNYKIILKEYNYINGFKFDNKFLRGIKI